MAQYTAYANYVIYFRDEDEYLAAIDIAGGGGYERSPASAATAFGLTIPPAGGELDPVKGMYTVSYSLAEPGSEIGHPLPSGVFLSPSVNSVIVPGQAGNPASIFPAGPDLNLVWRGIIMRAGGAAGANPDSDPTIAPLPQRRFIGGFEINGLNGEGGSFNGIAGCRDASRTIEGLGWAFRHDTSRWTRTLAVYQVGFTTQKSWERFYIRPRISTNTAIDIWACHGSPTDLNGAVLQINPDNTLSVYNTNALGPKQLLGTSVGGLDIDQWYRIDIVLSYDTGSGTGFIRIFQDGVEILTETVASADQGLGSTNNHARSALGNETGTANTAEIDFDDWINSAQPEISAILSLTSLDFLAGSHINLQYVVDAVLTNWAGNIASLNQMHNPSQALSSELTSSTSGASIDAETDETDEQTSLGQKIGAVAVVPSIWSSNAASTDGQLGYSVAGGADVLATIDQSNVEQYNTVAYRPSGTIIPDSIVPLNLVHTKSADTNASVVKGLQAIVEHIGTWGLMDDPSTIDIPLVPIIHNAYYFNTLWSFVGPVPDAPCFAIGGLYTGNGTFQDFEIPVPAHFIWVRALTGGVDGIKWHAAGLGGHRGGKDRVVPNYPIRVFVDENDATIVRIAGTDAQVNANGVVYQYIIYCDPGMRFNLCGAFRHNSALASYNNPLIDGTFTPIGGFVQSDLLGSASNTVGLFYKGPGFAGNTGISIAGSALTDFGSFAAGVYTSRASVHLASNQCNYSLWRHDDGTGAVMVQMLSYTGDGAGARTITLTPTSGRRPMFGLVMPHSGGEVGYFRDPSHTLLSSSKYDLSADVNTAIVGGGIDQLLIDSTLNANGVVYDVFVIPGGTVACNNGWSCNGEFYPPNAAAPGDFWPLPTSNPVDIGIIGSGGIVLDGDTSKLIIKDMSGIYRLTEGKTNDTVYTHQTGTEETDVKIPDPFAKTGYIGG